MRPAYVWDCPECGHEIFERTVIVDLPEEELAAMREEFGIEPWDTGNFQAMPSEVTCPHCGFEAETVHMCDDA